MDTKEQNIYQVLENNKQEESEQKIELANEEIVQENKEIPVKKIDGWKFFSLITIGAYFCLFAFLLAGITTFNKKSLNIVNSILLIIDFFSITSSTILEHILQLCACGLYYFTIGYSIKILIKMIKMFINGAKTKSFDIWGIEQKFSLGFLFIVLQLISTCLLGGELSILSIPAIIIGLGVNIAYETAWMIENNVAKKQLIWESIRFSLSSIVLTIIILMTLKIYFARLKMIFIFGKDKMKFTHTYMLMVVI